MKKGFTLVELLAVIAILGIVALITVPSVTNTINSSRRKACEEQERQIIDATKKYVTENDWAIDNRSGDVTIGTLEDSGYLKKGMLSAKNKEELPRNNKVGVSWDGIKYNYSFSLGC